MQVSQDEVTPGLVVRLDTTILRTLGDSMTNAEQTTDGDRAVVGMHDFLVVSVDMQKGVCIATPLFPKTAVGNQPLDTAKKAGTHDGWTTEQSFFSKWQHWRIPILAVVAASESDVATAETRRRYAADDPAELYIVRRWEERNRAPYRAA